MVEILSAEEGVRRPMSRPRIVAAFILRDFKVWWTYKLWLTLDIMGSIGFVATYYMLSRMIPSQRVAEAGYTRGGWFTFAVLGIAFQQYVFSSVQGIAQSIRDEQWNGTIETILSSAISFRTFLLGESCFYFAVASSFLVGSLSTGLALGMRLHLEPMALLSTAVLSILLVISHLALGMLSAGLIMKIKQGDPLAWAYSWMTQLVSGVFYPLGLLPPWLRWIGRAFPLTYSLDAIRLCLQGGQTLASPQVLTDILSLLAFTAAAIPIALYVFRLGYDAARSEGSLGEY